MKKFIEGYENLYSVDEQGNVFSHYSNKVLTPCTDGHGYWYVNLQKDGKRKSKKIHRIVAETFLPNPNNYPCVNHKDENTRNNCVNNLEWCTYEYNNIYGSRIERVKNKIIKKEDHKQKVKIIKCNKKTHEEICIYNSVGDAARDVGGSHSNIVACLKGRQKTSYGYFWKYLEETIDNAN